MCEPSVVGPNPLLHQIIPSAGNKQSKLFGLQVFTMDCSSSDPVGSVSSSVVAEWANGVRGPLFY